MARAFPHLLDGSLQELLERRMAADGSGMGTWVRAGVTIPRGFVFGVYSGRLQHSGTFRHSAYILASDSIEWCGASFGDLEIDGAPPASGGTVQLANAAGYNHTCGRPTASLRRHRWGRKPKRCVMAVASAPRRLVGPVQLRWNYGAQYTFSKREAVEARRKRVPLQPCMCAFPAQCPRALWLRKGK